MTSVTPSPAPQTEQMNVRDGLDHRNGSGPFRHSKGKDHVCP
jgi:hypothetical protein